MDKTIKTFSRGGSLSRWHVEIKQRDHNYVPHMRGTYYVIVCDNTYLWNDNPLRLPDGKILYDFPDRVPAYAKVLVVAAFAWLDSQKEKESEKCQSPTT